MQHCNIQCLISCLSKLDMKSKLALFTFWIHVSGLIENHSLVVSLWHHAILFIIKQILTDNICVCCLCSVCSVVVCPPRLLVSLLSLLALRLAPSNRAKNRNQVLFTSVLCLHAFIRSYTFLRLITQRNHHGCGRAAELSGTDAFNVSSWSLFGWVWHCLNCSAASDSIILNYNL